MFIKFVYDLTAAFGIVGGNHLGTVGIVEKQHVNYRLLKNLTLKEKARQKPGPFLCLSGALLSPSAFACP
jgi:hypothetical protein